MKTEKPNYVAQWLAQRPQSKASLHTVSFDLIQSSFAKTKQYNLKADVKSIMGTKPEVVSIFVPYDNRVFRLDLAKVDIVDKGFKVNNKTPDTGVQYRGIVDGNPAHIASVNLTETDKSIVFATDEGNFIVTQKGKNFIVYNDKVIIKERVSLQCETPDVEDLEPFEAGLTAEVTNKVVKVYFECDYALYQSKGSVSATTNYVLGLFNQVSTLYANEGITIQISNIFIWTTPDPYVGYNSPSAILTPFRSNRGTTFDGNLAHFLTTRNIGGGVAYVNTLCNKAFAYGVSRIYTTYSTFPTYSWSVNVIAHELGHNIGSPHTQSCTWSGGALDNCYTPEGSCSPGPAPVNGGTVMSYCHLTSQGINFNNGFGPQPGNLLRSRVSSATCLSTEGACPAPTTLTTTNITSSSARLNWTAVAGATSYIVQYKTCSAATWTTLTATTLTNRTISGLALNTSYTWQVKTNCSPYSVARNFTTL